MENLKLCFEDVDKSNLNFLVELALELWPDNDKEELTKEFINVIENDTNNKYIICKVENKYIAFIHVSIRHDYVEGSDKSPTGFVEGIYVKKNFRGKGIGKKLIEIGEDWALSRGCTQMGSDIEMDNLGSYNFHNKVGFKEVNRIICFLKEI